MYAFDMDGVLADTKTAVLQAYRLAGVEPPFNFFGLPVTSWMSENDMKDGKHKLKNQFYKHECSHLIKPLPLIRLQQITHGAILTGASEEAAKVVLERLDIPRPDTLHTGLTVLEKIKTLNLLSVCGHYFDDNLEAALEIKENTKWQVHIIQQL
jgi:beta-phosphoglucomutase-like phosphatase (HAD superfamily)